MAGRVLPFSRLGHVWSVPPTYLQRSWPLYRSRNPRAALRFERSRVPQSSAASEERARP